LGQHADANVQRASPTLDKRYKGVLDFAVAAGIEDDELLPNGRSRSPNTPGRLRLVTRPFLTGSSPVAKTIGTNDGRIVSECQAKRRDQALENHSDDLECR
jgi:hypothetical protein